MTQYPLCCRACAAPLTWTGEGRRPHYCTDADCRRHRANDRAYRYFLRTRWKGAHQDGRTYTPRPVQPALSLEPADPIEPDARVERLLAQARARRLAEERRTGQRRYRIETGWQQRPGAGTINFNADTQDWGFR